MAGITGIGHVAIRVRDLDAALAFYTGVLGFPEMMRLHGPQDGRLWLVYLRVTDDHYVEIFPDADTERAPPPMANGLNHLCLTVEDLDGVVADLEAKGARITVRPKMGLDHNRQAWLEDPDGNRIELMEMAPDSLQGEAIRRLAGSGA